LAGRSNPVGIATLPKVARNDIYFMLSIIAVIGKNRELGRHNQLIFKIPDDLQHFRQVTSGHPVIMGRKTFLSLPHVLPNRTNIIISQNLNYQVEKGIVVHSLSEAVKVGNKSPGGEEIFVIGGGQIYQEAINQADRLYLTLVESEAKDADTFFPDYSFFQKIISSEPHFDGTYHFKYLVLEK
jgi:dihydrofolate reductase